jgi:cytidine deaminase
LKRVYVSPEKWINSMQAAKAVTDCGNPRQRMVEFTRNQQTMASITQVEPQGEF